MTAAQPTEPEANAAPENPAGLSQEPDRRTDAGEKYSDEQNKKRFLQFSLCLSPLLQ